MWIGNFYINAKNIVTIGPFIEDYRYGIVINGEKFTIYDSDVKMDQKISKINKKIQDLYIDPLIKEIQRESKN